MLRWVFSSLLCVPLAQPLFSESSSPGPLGGDHPLILGLGNLGCYIFSSASMQTPVDHCFSVGKRGDSFLGNPTLLHSCPCPYLQRWPGYSGAWRGIGGFLLGDVGCPSRTAWSVVQTPCGSSGNIYSPVKILQNRVQEYSHALTMFIIISFVALC